MKKTDDAIIANELQYIKRDIAEIKEDLRESKGGYVSQAEFAPIRTLVFGFVGLVLVAVVGAILALVVRT